MIFHPPLFSNSSKFGNSGLSRDVFGFFGSSREGINPQNPNFGAFPFSLHIAALIGKKKTKQQNLEIPVASLGFKAKENGKNKGIGAFFWAQSGVGEGLKQQQQQKEPRGCSDSSECPEFPILIPRDGQIPRSGAGFGIRTIQKGRGGLSSARLEPPPWGDEVLGHPKITIPKICLGTCIAPLHRHPQIWG